MTNLIILIVLQIALMIFYIQILLHCAFNPKLSDIDKKRWLIWLGIFNFLSALVYFIRFKVWKDKEDNQEHLDYED